MSLWHVERGLKQAGRKDLAKIVAGVREAYGQDIPLPQTKPSERSVKTQLNLREETYELLANLKEPTPEEREAFRKQGFVFLPIGPKSLGQFYEEEAGYFGYVNSSDALRKYKPSQFFEIAVNPKKLRIPRSNDSSQEKQLRLTKEHSQKEIEPISAAARAVMLPATAIAQADIEYQKQNNGKVLIPNFWVRALDTTVGPYVAYVGRNHPADPLSVHDWRRFGGLPNIWALSAVVFVKN